MSVVAHTDCSCRCGCCVSGGCRGSWSMGEVLGREGTRRFENLHQRPRDLDIHFIARMYIRRKMWNILRFVAQRGHGATVYPVLYHFLCQFFPRSHESPRPSLPRIPRKLNRLIRSFEERSYSISSSRFSKSASATTYASRERDALARPVD